MLGQTQPTAESNLGLVNLLKLLVDYLNKQCELMQSVT